MDTIVIKEHRRRRWSLLCVPVEERLETWWDAVSLNEYNDSKFKMFY